jgi:peptide/nickel transport system substrate-binding protein
MHFSGPWPVALQMIVHQQILPKAYLEEVGTQGFVANPIGAGPFKFVSATAGLDEVVMERFDDYYGGAPTLEPVGPACVGSVVFRAIPEASTRIAALLAREVDIIQGVPPEMVASLPRHRASRSRRPGHAPRWMQMNVQQPPFDDVLVRQALNYAVDKELMIEAI